MLSYLLFPRKILWLYVSYSAVLTSDDLSDSSNGELVAVGGEEKKNTDLLGFPFLAMSQTWEAEEQSCCRENSKRKLKLVNEFCGNPQGAVTFMIGEISISTRL